MTVLFQKDWTNDKGALRAIPHLSTKNDSFLRTCQLLKKLGVKNYAFPLALYDPDLKDVDVHALEDDTPENLKLRIKVQIESRRNAFYFLRECIRIYEQGGAPVRFRLDRGSCAMAWCFLNGIDYVGMQPRQTGKALVLDAKVRTPSGWVRNGDIKLNQSVVTPDGTHAKVVGVYPQGELDIYRVTFEDGRSVECCDDHLWKVHWTHWGEEGGGKWRVLSLKQIREHMDATSSSKNRLSVPLVAPEIKDDIDLPIDPYVLGVILGDGNTTNGTVSICKPDQFIKDELDRLLYPKYQTSPWHAGGKSYTIVATKGYMHMKHDLIGLRLWDKLHDEKFIPKMYMHGSARQKQALLQGLMDTDGTAEKPRMCKDGITPKHGAIEFSTTSQVMAEQVQELFRSLGALCKLTSRQTYYPHNGVKKKGKISYRVTPRVSDRSTVFRLPRKRERCDLGQHKYQDTLKLAIRKVEYVGKKDAQCIEVDHPDHLYITDDYIVTHNTVCALSLTAWILYSSGYEYAMGALSKDNRLREDNVKRVKTFGENLPSWWLSPDKHKDKNNASEIQYAALRTQYMTFVAQSDKAAADKQARGASLPALHIDELDFCVNIGTTYPIMLASTGTARANAKKNGQPHSNIITTTAGDPTTVMCQEAMKITAGAMPFTELLFDLDDYDQLHKVVESNSAKRMIIGIFSHLQLGHSNEWLKEKIQRYGLTRDEVMRDFLNRRVSIQENPIIPKDILARITSSQKEPSYIELLADNFVIYWYVSKETVESAAFKDRPMVVGCDSSEMIGRDATTLVGIDPTNMAVLCTFRCSEGNLSKLGVMVAMLLLKYPKMLWVPENKSSGTTLIDIVAMLLKKEHHNPFKRIFNWVVNNQDEPEFARYDYRDLDLLDTTAKRHFGIKTDKTKRDELYGSTLLAGASKAADVMNDATLIQELGSLTTKNGRIDHTAGGHDDLVVAFLMAVYVIINGKHLHVYGIKPGTVMSHINPGKPDKNRLSQEHHQKIRLRIEHLEKMYRQQHDPILAKHIQTDINVYKSMIQDAPMLTPETADALVRDPKQFTDRTIAENSRNGEPRTTEQTFRMVMGLT